MRDQRVPSVPMGEPALTALAAEPTARRMMWNLARSGNLMKFLRISCCRPIEFLSETGLFLNVTEVRWQSE